MYRIAPPPKKRRDRISAAFGKTKVNKHRGPAMIKIKRRQFRSFNTENNSNVVKTIVCRVQPSN